MWFHNQNPIGGEGVEVEINETLIVHHKYNSCFLKQLRLFGGIEISTKCRFMISLNSTGEKINNITLFPLITKCIKSNSVISSNAWPTYKGINELGYKHFMINH